MSQINMGPNGSPSVPITFVCDTGTATAALNILNVVGGVGSNTVGSGNTVTLNVVTDSFKWTTVTGTSVALVKQNGYILNNAGLITATLPATAAVGDTILLYGLGAGLYAIAQNAGQTIHLKASSTTVGVGGSLTAIDTYASIRLTCIVANTDFTAETDNSFTIV